MIFEKWYATMARAQHIFFFFLKIREGDNDNDETTTSNTHLQFDCCLNVGSSLKLPSISGIRRETAPLLDMSEESVDAVYTATHSVLFNTIRNKSKAIG